MSPRPKTGKPRAHGQIRQSQIITTFGPGALVDLPNHAAIIGGLEGWSRGIEEIPEPRLVEKLKRLLGRTSLRLYPPPPHVDDPRLPPTGITIWQFPEWYVTQDTERDPKNPTRRTRRLVHRRDIQRACFVDEDKVKHPVVPIRFVRACRKGHIGDINWAYFVHPQEKRNCRRRLFVDEFGTSGDLGEIRIRCECGARRPMSDAARMEMFPLGICFGERPWLGPGANEECGEPNRLLIRTASNAYFPQLMSVISIPDRNEGLVEAVNQAWAGCLEYVEDMDALKYERRKPPVTAALGDFTDDEVMAEIKARKGGGGGGPTVTVKNAEYETLASSKDEIGSDRPDGNFYARALKKKWAEAWMKGIERVVLVHRLREVMAQVGFTRFEASAPDTQGELEMGVQRAAISREADWLPAVENRGEGIFISFRKDEILRWLQLAEVKEREKKLRGGFEKWKNEHEGSRREFPGAAYIMLHSFSHLLLTALSLECGYPASSIRERVYAADAGYGVLLFTGSPDAEGTLGGLVGAGNHIERHIGIALENGRLCSNDPVCAQHPPDSHPEKRYLQGAACHGCLLISETSCEMYNDFLDRALVVPTIDCRTAAFFAPTP